MKIVLVSLLALLQLLWSEPYQDIAACAYSCMQALKTMAKQIKFYEGSSTCSRKRILQNRWARRSKKKSYKSFKLSILSYFAIKLCITK